MAVVFSYPGTSPATVVTFATDPEVGDYAIRLNYMNPQAQACGGKRYVYNRGICKEIRTLKWTKMRTVDFTALMAFLAAVDGTSHYFEYTDPNGNLSNAWIWNADELRSNMVAYATEEIAVELLVAPPILDELGAVLLDELGRQLLEE